MGGEKKKVLRTAPRKNRHGLPLSVSSASVPIPTSFHNTASPTALCLPRCGDVCFLHKTKALQNCKVVKAQGVTWITAVN